MFLHFFLGVQFSQPYVVYGQNMSSVSLEMTNYSLMGMVRVT